MGGSGPVARLSQLAKSWTRSRPMTIPWDPDSDDFPTFAELPKIPGAPEGAAWVWGQDDNLGRINLLTPKRVKRAAQEVKLGEMIPLNLPLDVPAVPAFERQAFEHSILPNPHARGKVFDDTYTLNTQSGTQWDGFRHFAHMASGSFYNGTSPADIDGPAANTKASIAHLASHGIAGRGVLLDFAAYADGAGIAFDPFARFEVSLAALHACARSQGIDPRPRALGGDILLGDMLFVRIGWTRRYGQLSPAERRAAALRKEQEWAGLSQTGGTVEWLHDCYFATVAGDMPSFEAWPTRTGTYLHEYLLALWGVPIGEMLDLEQLSQRCRELNRWTFFVSSAPANCPRGVASHVNGIAFL